MEQALHNHFLRLHTKLQRTAKHLRSWARNKIGNNKLLMMAAKQLIGILDVVQEYRQLSSQEITLKRDLKNRLLAMAAIEKMRSRQNSRTTYIKAGEAHSKLFFLAAKGRRQKKHIQTLHTDQGIVHSHEQKQIAIFEHFKALLGSCPVRHEL